MITLTSDIEHYMDSIKVLDKKMYREIYHHDDVLRDTLHVALFDGRFAGVCFLMATSSYLHLETEQPAYYLQGEFKAVADDSEVEVSEVLIDVLKNDYKELKLLEKNKDKNLVLRLWCPSDSYAYLDFLCFQGFETGKLMLVMNKTLEEQYNGFFNPVEEGPELPPSMSIKELLLGTDEEMSRYMEANAEAFGVADSEAELRYRQAHYGARIYAVMQGKHVIASMTTWPNNSDQVSTENVFCRKAYRRQGITKALLTKVCNDLADEHFDEATLTVYGDDQPAIQLYMSLGYEVVGAHQEMLYRVDAAI